MKTEIIVGDTLDFETTVTDYPATDGWTLYHRLVPRTAGAAISMTAVTASDGISYRTQVAPAVTAAYVAGEYAWNSWVAKTGARQSVESGQVTLLPDPAVTAAPMDNRGHAQKMVDAIESVINGAASRAEASYSTGDRSLLYKTDAELRVAWSFWSRQLAAENAAAKLANGENPRNRLLVRF